jgi:hypothetical protein
MTYDILAWDGHKNMAGLNQVMGSPNPPSLDDWVSKGNAIKKKKMHRFASTQKDCIYTITK